MTHYSRTHLLESPDFPFYISPFVIPPDWNSPHTHEFIECVYVADGVGEHIYNGRAYPISRGDIFIIEPNIEHGYRVLGGSPMEVYNVLFLPSLLESELRQLAQVTPFVNFFYVEPLLREPSDFQYHLKLNVNEGLETKLLLDRIHREFTAKGLGYRLSVKAMLMELFISLSRSFEGRSAQPLSTPRDETTLERVCAFVRQHYAQPIMMEQIYQMCGMCPSNFTAKFKQYAGKTFTEYRNDIRMDVARLLLLQTDRKILEIALEVGFDDVSHFNKVFKQHTRHTPSRFRYSARQREAAPVH